MGLGFEIIWPGKPDCEQGAMYGREECGVGRVRVVACAIPACSSFELLQNIQSSSFQPCLNFSHFTNLHRLLIPTLYPGYVENDWCAGIYVVHDSKIKL